ncbi:hypothetical protein JMJ35_005839 [Cladonia borealis]|uniref:Uncharacterized protein n=1 Tax=Cladonia borealis TaxID=184061 RepID=A0AA39R0N4_9LECA|nr:hypothetical protein JMJ35_005839 [Cladonia borealis]
MNTANVKEDRENPERGLLWLLSRGEGDETLASQSTEDSDASDHEIGLAIDDEDDSEDGHTDGQIDEEEDDLPQQMQDVELGESHQTGAEDQGSDVSMEDNSDTFSHDGLIAHILLPRRSVTGWIARL